MAGFSLSTRPSRYALKALLAGVLSLYVGVAAYSEETLPTTSTSAQDAFPLDANPSQLPALNTNYNTAMEAEPAVKAKAVVVDILSDTLDYDTAKNAYTATGNVKVVVSEQNTELWGDKVLYDPTQEIMTAFGNVVINNKGQKVYGTYAKIDLTRQSALINDPITALGEVRIKARQAFVDGKVSRLFNGKLVVLPKFQPADPSTLVWAGESDADISKLAIQQPLTGPNQKNSLPTGPGTVDTSKYPNTLVPQDLDMSWDGTHAGFSSAMQYYTKQVDVIRGEDGYDEINAISPVLKYKNFPLARLPQMDFANVGPAKELEYLGPDIGVDPDFGGFYYGPGWDFRLGDGFLRTSPFVSFGVGQRRRRSGQDIEDISGLGGGLMTHYLSSKTNIAAGYNVLVGSPSLVIDRKMFGDDKTRLLLSANDDYTRGFFGFERPRYSAQLTDRRPHFEDKLLSKNVAFITYGTIGGAYDEFFPTNQNEYFIEKPKVKPVWAGRGQVQFSLRNVEPLLSIGTEKNRAELGWEFQGSNSVYSTGDFYGIMRAGPRARVRLFNDRFSSINRYFYGVELGDSPFVFDRYIAGRNSVQTDNMVFINKYLSLGMRTQFSLASDNARSDLVTSNFMYALFGPEDVKFNIAYDVIRQRSFFGINIMQGKAHKTLHYERMDIYQPQDYDGPPAMTSAAPAMANPATDMFGNVNDVGMMNGNAAR
ncbi:MAG: hypothetical protein QE263_04065 [Vampirovibrionales bacterium]|nr:hypothetical protein [Vampirovibrionales bacterium]